MTGATRPGQGWGMASVETFEPCPQCGADAHSSFQTRTGDVELYCLRCGYREDHLSDDAPHPGFGTFERRGSGVVTQTSFLSATTDLAALRATVADDPEVVRAFMRLPPRFRAELLRGTLDSAHDLTPTEMQLLNDALAPFGEQVAAIEHTELFTSHDSEPGYRRFVCWRTEQQLEISRLGDCWPFLTLRDGVATLTLSAPQEVLLG
ncbi:hypothetical protein MF271_24445 (plasmid) [Deinococcus sp. KNUC1210]|uniref:hypothetical protein n=1 Tax=Deinococcus sp. KNUC1210 TaxID=2917691 RepID=UPI001EF128DE|nr:hypothetical protein [Deinococcus sp. KNUC1210]ULH18107.1 hypothetical protein MF271_24445 [Deinococcus sp. KNUC1210]